MNLMMLLEMAASGFGDRVAVTNGAESLTYAELYAAAGAAAAEIEVSGCDRVALLDVNSLAVPVGLFAASWAGLPFAPLNYRLTGGELEALLGRIAPSYLIAEPTRCDELEGVAATTVISRDDFLKRARSGAEVAPPWPMDPELTAVLLFTSGTTGEPKAAVLRHKHLVSYVLGSVEFMSAAETDAALVSVPPYHVAGMASIASSVYAGRRIVQLPNFSAEGWVAAANTERITNAMVVPTMLVRIIDHLEHSDDARLESVKAISYGGGKMPLPVIEKAMKLLAHVDFTNAYGLTETSSTISVLTPADHRDAASSSDPDVRRRLGSLGSPLPSVRVEIRGPSGEVLGPGETGEIYVKGEQVSGEYEGLGTRLDTDGWFPTRDAGWLDAAGYLFLDGRIDDIIVRGGENISPGEVEAVIIEHDDVSDCAVVGIPDEQWGEAVAAVVIVREGKTLTVPEVQTWVRDRLRSSRAPALVEFAAELPYNETGKLLRRTVRAELLGSGSA